MENWKKIDRAPEYSVSDKGNVRRNKNGKLVTHYFHTESGRPYVVLSVNGERSCFSLPRLVANAFIPNPEDKPDVVFKNGKVADCRAVNLEWAGEVPSLCWSCANCVPDCKGRGCPWSERFEPVPGWEAEPTRIVSYFEAGKPHIVDSYHVKKCPMFKEDN